VTFPTLLGASTNSRNAFLRGAFRCSRGYERPVGAIQATLNGYLSAAGTKTRRLTLRKSRYFRPNWKMIVEPSLSVIVKP
jgi:hypothetical protein